MTQAVGPVVYSLLVNGSKVSDVPLDYELIQDWYCHDLMFVRIVVPKGKQASVLKAYPDNAAVQVTWGRYPTSVQNWYGYINHHVISTSDDTTGQNVQITYIFIGTSKPMNADVSKTWTNMTGPAIAQAIARKYMLRCVVSTSTWVLPYEVQANESDFEFLVRIAMKTGYRFWVSGATLYFINPTVLLSGQSLSFIPQYSINKLPNIQDTAQNFQVLQGDAIPGAYQMPRSIFGLDMNTGQVYQATASGSTGTGSIVNSTYDVSSRAEAQNIADASQALSQFFMQATVEVFGYGLLYPGKTINLSGVAIPNGDTGNWIVMRADHVLKLGGSPDPTSDHYVTRLVIGRNTQAAPFVKGVHQITPEIMNCTLTGASWRAQTPGVVVEGVFG